MKLKTTNLTRPQISLTPLIDIVFILLIFFMLVTKMETYQSLALILSPPDGESSTNKIKNEIQITLTKSGEIIYQKQRYPLSHFIQLVPANTINKLNINIEFAVTAQQFVSLKETLSRSGYTNIEEWIIPSEIEL